MTTLERKTGETTVRVTLARGGGADTVATGDAFFDHMLVTLARFAALDLGVEASGDLRHHLLEDVALTLGEALRREIPETCARFGDRTVPMDDALVQVTLDLVGRPYWSGPLPSALYDHVFRSLADSARLTLHVRVLRGVDRPHVIEAAFTALGLALRDAMADGGAVFSTKGSVTLREGGC